jgi:UDP-N-acetylmuramate dehydrogenase
MLKSTAPDRYVVLAVTYRLEAGGPARVRYADLEQHIAGRGIRVPSLAEVRESVLAIRRGKSMVLDPTDPNRRSCGSFFLNPVVAAEEIGRIEARTGDAAMPRWPQPGGRVKLSAAWLIERAGFARGERDGPVGLSTRHTLAIVCHDGARTRDVLRFAERIRSRVEQRFGVRLSPEPAGLATVAESPIRPEGAPAPRGSEPGPVWEWRFSLTGANETPRRFVL